MSHSYEMYSMGNIVNNFVTLSHGDRSQLDLLWSFWNAQKYELAKSWTRLSDWTEMTDELTEVYNMLSVNYTSKPKKQMHIK